MKQSELVELRERALNHPVLSMMVRALGKADPTEGARIKDCLNEDGTYDVRMIPFLDALDLEFATYLEAHTQAAVEAERERCAKVAEQLPIGGGTLSSWVNTNESPMGATRRHIATAIRSQSPLYEEGK